MVAVSGRAAAKLRTQRVINRAPKLNSYTNKCVDRVDYTPRCVQFGLFTVRTLYTVWTSRTVQSLDSAHSSGLSIRIEALSGEYRADNGGCLPAETFASDALHPTLSTRRSSNALQTLTARTPDSARRFRIFYVRKVDGHCIYYSGQATEKKY